MTTQQAIRLPLDPAEAVRADAYAEGLARYFAGIRHSPFVDKPNERAHRQRGIRAEFAVAAFLEVRHPARITRAGPVDLLVGGHRIEVKCPARSGAGVWWPAKAGERIPATERIGRVRASLGADFYLLVWPTADPLLFEGAGYLPRREFAAALHLADQPKGGIGIVAEAADFRHSLTSLYNRIVIPDGRPPRMAPGRIDLGQPAGRIPPPPPPAPREYTPPPDCAGLPYAQKCRRCQRQDDHEGIPANRCRTCGESTGSAALGYCARCSASAPPPPRTAPREITPERAAVIAAMGAREQARIESGAILRGYRDPANASGEGAEQVAARAQKRLAHPQFGDEAVIAPDPSLTPRDFFGGGAGGT